jgi:hypothetical protein
MTAALKLFVNSSVVTLLHQQMEAMEGNSLRKDVVLPSIY